MNKKILSKEFFLRLKCNSQKNSKNLCQYRPSYVLFLGKCFIHQARVPDINSSTFYMTKILHEYTKFMH